MITRKEAWGGGGGCRRRGSGVSLCGVIHVSLVQGSVPRRQAWAGLSTRLHWDSPRATPAGEQRYLFSVRFRYLAHAALGSSEPVSHGLGMTTYLAVVVPGY
jgi:hypothetical protein